MTPGSRPTPRRRRRGGGAAGCSLLASIVAGLVGARGAAGVTGAYYTWASTYCFEWPAGADEGDALPCDNYAAPPQCPGGYSDKGEGAGRGPTHPARADAEGAQG